MSEEVDVATIGALLEDPTVRTILVRTSQEPMSASTLSQYCEASEATVYRRLDELSEFDLVEERTLPDLENGHHETVYSATLRRITVTVDDGAIEFELDRREDVADRFTRLIEEM